MANSISFQYRLPRGRAWPLLLLEGHFQQFLSRVDRRCKNGDVVIFLLSNVLRGLTGVTATHIILCPKARLSTVSWMQGYHGFQQIRCSSIDSNLSGACLFSAWGCAYYRFSIHLYSAPPPLLPPGCPDLAACWDYCVWTLNTVSDMHRIRVSFHS